MRFLCLILCASACVENTLTESDSCDQVGAYALCREEESEEDARYICAEMEMVLINFFVDGMIVDPNKYKEIYLLGDAEFDGDSWWIDAPEELYTCTIMLHGSMYPEQCQSPHPFICEV